MAKPLVGIVMGSDSDQAIMSQAAETLTELGIPFDVDVMSAHRSPQRVADYADGARRGGLQIIIAGAGLAAHLAGAIAAHTTLPVIGVPLASGTLQGLDALLSTAQMPKGVPVATVAINGAANAALLAAQILALHNRELAAKLAKRKTEAGADKPRK